jgi:hypothetical protein
MFYAVARYDFYDANNAPDLKDIADSLKHAKPLPSAWKSVDPSNRSGAALLAFGLYTFVGLLIFRSEVISFINRL